MTNETITEPSADPLPPTPTDTEPSPDEPQHTADIVPFPYPTAKSLLNDNDLPGPLSMNLLTRHGAIMPLDAASGYQSEHAGTLYGRATIINDMIPHRSTACALTATWLWLGGRFPETIDIISRSHYRAYVHHRKVRVFNRKSPADHVIQVGDTRVTTPARTVCDLSLLPDRTTEADGQVDTMISDLMTEYRVTPDDCIRILDGNPFWPRAAIARSRFEHMERP